MQCILLSFMNIGRSTISTARQDKLTVQRREGVLSSFWRNNNAWFFTFWGAIQSCSGLWSKWTSLEWNKGSNASINFKPYTCLGHITRVLWSNRVPWQFLVQFWAPPPSSISERHHHHTLTSALLVWIQQVAPLLQMEHSQNRMVPRRTVHTMKGGGEM